MGRTEELVFWRDEQKCKKVVENLKVNGFNASYIQTAKEAADYILNEAVTSVTVGFGGSMSVAGIGIEALLREDGKEILNHNNPALSAEEKLEMMRSQLTCDLFLSGCNALTMKGELVNIDATGNRVAALSFGPRKVIVVVGKNKLVNGTLQDAIARVKNDVTPPNAKRLDYKTPCAITGFCSDCNAPTRLCRIITVIDRTPRLTDMHVLVVNEELGF